MKNLIQVHDLHLQAIEIEEAVLGAILLDTEAIENAYDLLNINTFYKPAHQAIWEAMVELYKVRDSIDMLTVVQKLRKMGKIDMAGGTAYVMGLTNHVSSAANIETHCRFLKEHEIKREAQKFANNLLAKLSDPTADVFDVQNNILDFSRNMSTGVFSNKLNVASLFDEVADRLVANVGKEGLIGIPSGILEIDNATGGWRNGDLIYIGGRASMGKTMFMLNLMMNAICSGYKVGIFSIESSGLEIINRLVALELNRQNMHISNSQLARSVGFNKESAEKLAQKIKTEVKSLYANNILVNDASIITTKEIKAQSKRWKAEGVDIIFVDYLQYITSTNTNKTYTKHHEVGGISRDMKAIAKDLDLPVLPLAQLSRAADEDGKNGILPDKKHFKESGDIENDGDVMLTLYRPSYYKLADFQGTPSENLLVSHIVKNRDGASGLANMHYFNPAEGIIKSLDTVPTPF